MAVGENALMGHQSYLAIGREVTYGTYVTATSALAILSNSLKVSKDTKILEEITANRTNSISMQLGKSVAGDLEYYFYPKSAACNYILHNAFGGGPVTSATSTGETVGGAAFSHTVNIGNFNATYSSLSANSRKGETSTGKIFEYSGIRVDEMTFVGEIDEPLMVSASLICKDGTLSTNDVSSGLSYSTQGPLSFVSGRISIETTVAGLTTTSFWHVQSMEFKISNQLNSDSSSRRIGSDLISILPAGLAKFEFKVSMRFDTTTAYDAMIAGTRLVGEFEFLGDTMSSSAIREGIKLTMPNLRIKDAGDPEIGGPNEQLNSEVVFEVLRDPTASGYAVRAVVTNNTSSYA